MHRLSGLVVLALSIGGCRYGTSAETFPPAQGPEGVTVRLEAGSMGLRGELIEVRVEAILLRVGGQIWLVDYEDIGSARLEQYAEDLGMGSGRTPGEGDRRELGLLARFPQGMSPDLVDQLLRVHGQTRFRTLGDP